MNDNLRAAKRKLRSLSYGPKGQDPTKLFNHYDRDNSGELNFQEFKAAVRKGGHLSAAMLSDRDLKQLFEAVDSDGSDDVSIDELTAFVWGTGGDDLNSSKETAVDEQQHVERTRSSIRKPPRFGDVSSISSSTPQALPSDATSQKDQVVTPVVVEPTGSAETEDVSPTPDAAAAVIAERMEEAVPPQPAARAQYYHVVSATVNVYDSPQVGAKILATLDQGDIIKALKLVSMKSSSKSDGSVATGMMAVHFAGGWVRTLGALGQTTILPLGELPASRTYARGFTATSSNDAAQEDVPPETPLQPMASLEPSLMVRCTCIYTLSISF